MDNKVIKAAGKKFGFTLANASGAAIVIALLAGIFDTAKVTAAGSPLAYTVAQTDITHLNSAGYAVGAVADDGTIATSVTATAAFSKFSIRQFREYVKLNGLVVKSITIQASNTDVFNNGMEVINHNPLEGPTTQYIDLSTFKSVNQEDSTKIVMENLNMPIDNETIIKMTLPASRQVNILFQFE